MLWYWVGKYEIARFEKLGVIRIKFGLSTFEIWYGQCHCECVMNKKYMWSFLCGGQSTVVCKFYSTVELFVH